MNTPYWTVITGAGSGIGRALALKMAQKGFRVLGAGRRLSPLQDLAKQNPLIEVVSADVGTHHGRLMINDALPENAVVAHLVHNAGILAPITPLANLSESEWGNHIAINVNGPLFLTQRLLERMKEGCRILHVSSGAAHKAYQGWGAYCASKAALNMIYRVFDMELKDRGIRVGSARPGVVDTPMQNCVRQAPAEVFPDLPRFKALKAEGNLLAPATVAHFLAWLLLDVAEEAYAAKEWDIREEGPERFT